MSCPKKENQRFAKELIEKEGIEFVAVNPPKELKRDKKVTLDAF